MNWNKLFYIHFDIPTIHWSLPGIAITISSLFWGLRTMCCDHWLGTLL